MDERDIRAIERITDAIMKVTHAPSEDYDYSAIRAALLFGEDRHVAALALAGSSHLSVAVAGALA